VNQNQGAESTLSFLLASAELHLLAGSRTTFGRATDTDPAEYNFLASR
jgi:hypothetical protein